MHTLSTADRLFFDEMAYIIVRDAAPPRMVQAVVEIEEIVRIPQLAGVLIGPNDLAAALGLIFQKEHPRVLAAIDKVKVAARQAGLPVGMAGLSDPESAVQWLQSGFQFATLGNINGMLMRASWDFVASVREGIA